MWQNRLARAHYVDQKWAVWGLFWANFAVVGAMKFPFCVVSPRYGAEMRYRVCQGVCWGCSDFFCFAGPPFRAFRTFLPQAGGFYVGLRGCFQERLLCVFTRVTLSVGANPCALVTTALKQGSSVLWQSGVSFRATYPRGRTPAPGRFLSPDGPSRLSSAGDFHASGRSQVVRADDHRAALCRWC